jgi:uncharacterized membrane protein YgdD (TMEM256/DUF423 family)
MRFLHIASALSGALALVMLAMAVHAWAGDPHVGFVYFAAGSQLAAACAGLAIANRSGRINLIAGWLIVAGAFEFAGFIYLNAFGFDIHGPAAIGGFAMIAGWIVLAFAKPA